MSFWLILKNVGLIYDTFKLVGKILPQAVREKKLPDCAESQVLLKNVIKLLEGGVIDVPQVDEKEIAAALKQIEERMQCSQ